MSARMKVRRQPADGATRSATASAINAPTAYSEKMTPPAPIARRLAGHASTVYGTPTASSPAPPRPVRKRNAADPPAPPADARGRRGQAVEGDRRAKGVLAPEPVGGVAEGERPQGVARQHD